MMRATSNGTHCCRRSNTAPRYSTHLASHDGIVHLQNRVASSLHRGGCQPRTHRPHRRGPRFAVHQSHPTRQTLPAPPPESPGRLAQTDPTDDRSLHSPLPVVSTGETPGYGLISRRPTCPPPAPPRRVSGPVFPHSKTAVADRAPPPLTVRRSTAGTPPAPDFKCTER